MNDAANISKRPRLARNSIYGLLSWLLPAVPSLIVTPIVVHRLGNESYGLYAAILGITSFFFTLGVGKIAAKYVAEYTAAGEAKRAAELLTVTLIVTAVATIISVTILIGATPYLVDNVLRIDPGMRGTAISGVWIAGALILFTAIAQVWQSALQGLHRFDTFLWLSNAMSLLLSVGLLVVVFSGGGVLGLLLWAAANALLTLIFSFAALKWVWPQSPLLRMPSDEWRPVIVYALSVIGYQFFGVVILLFERGWIIREFGLESVAFYLIPLNLALLLLGFTSSALSALFPALNAHLDDSAKIGDLYRRASKFVVIFAALAIVGAIGTGKTFLYLWLGPDFADRSWPLLVVHTITFSLVSLSLIWWQLAETYRRAPATAYANLAVMLITIPLMVALGGMTGLTGVAVGRLAGLLPYAVLWVYVERRFAGGFSTMFWASVIGRLVIPAVLTYGVLWASATYLADGWATWLLGVAVGTTVYMVASYLTGIFDSEELALFRSIIFRKAADARL